MSNKNMKKMTPDEARDFFSKLANSMAIRCRNAGMELDDFISLFILHSALTLYGAGIPEDHAKTLLGEACDKAYENLKKR